MKGKSMWVGFGNKNFKEFWDFGKKEKVFEKWYYYLRLVFKICESE